jgi:hypothetical protein
MHNILSSWSKEAGNNNNNNNNNTLLQGITEIGAQRAMKNHRKAMHELKTHIPEKSTEGDICRPP